MTSMLTDALEFVRSWRDCLALPEAARAERRNDLRGLPAEDPGAELAARAAIAWLCRAQDHSRSADGGVARHFSLRSGWAESYPETTGYILPTFLECAERWRDDELRTRARRMLDWLVAIQRDDGGFPGGVIGATPIVSVTFNTGQILLGLAAGVRAFGDTYRPALRRAADWLVTTQDADGCWRRHPTPFAKRGDKAYETHVAWGLLEADRVEPDRGYGDAALCNIAWALTHQRSNGWFANCCLNNPAEPLTHTIGYALRGVIEGYRYSGDQALLTAARRTADSLLRCQMAEGQLPGRFDAEWRGTVSWACLTGIVQIAACWMLLYQETGDARYRDAAFASNRFVRRTLSLQGNPDTAGGVKGSFPVSGGYGPYEYLNWAAKFFVDANLLEAPPQKLNR